MLYIFTTLGAIGVGIGLAILLEPDTLHVAEKNLGIRPAAASSVAGHP